VIILNSYVDTLIFYHAYEDYTKDTSRRTLRKISLHEG